VTQIRYRRNPTTRFRARRHRVSKNSSIDREFATALSPPREPADLRKESERITLPRPRPRPRGARLAAPILPFAGNNLDPRRSKPTYTRPANTSLIPVTVSPYQRQSRRHGSLSQQARDIGRRTNDRGLARPQGCRYLNTYPLRMARVYIGAVRLLVRSPGLS